MSHRNRRDLHEAQIPGVSEGVMRDDMNRENNRQERARRRGSY